MKKLVVPFLALGFAGAMFAAPSAEAGDTGKSKTINSLQSRPCRKVTVAAMSKTAPAAPSGNANFSSDYYDQHPSGGG